MGSNGLPPIQAGLLYHLFINFFLLLKVFVLHDCSCVNLCVCLAIFMVKNKGNQFPHPLTIVKNESTCGRVLLCYCGPAGTLSDMTSVSSEPGVTSCSHRCHGFSIGLCVFSRQRLSASCFNSATHIFLALQLLTALLLKLTLVLTLPAVSVPLTNPFAAT